MTIAGRGRSMRSSRAPTSDDMTKASNQARNRMSRMVPRPPSRSSTRSVTQEREVGAAEREEDDEPPALAWTDAGALPGHPAITRPGPMPTA